MTVIAVWEFMLLDEFDRLKPVARQHLPFYAWPGGYPIIYFTVGGNDLCADCATRALYLLDEESDPPVTYDAYYEGPPIQCDDCGRLIESAYGDPDSPSEKENS